MAQLADNQLSITCCHPNNKEMEKNVNLSWKTEHVVEELSPF